MRNHSPNCCSIWAMAIFPTASTFLWCGSLSIIETGVRNGVLGGCWLVEGAESQQQQMHVANKEWKVQRIPAEAPKGAVLDGRLSKRPMGPVTRCVVAETDSLSEEERRSLCKQIMRCQELGGRTRHKHQEKRSNPQAVQFDETCVSVLTCVEI